MGNENLKQKINSVIRYGKVVAGIMLPSIVLCGAISGVLQHYGNKQKKLEEGILSEPIKIELKINETKQKIDKIIHMKAENFKKKDISNLIDEYESLILSKIKHSHNNLVR